MRKSTFLLIFILITISHVFAGSLQQGQYDILSMYSAAAPAGGSISLDGTVGHTSGTVATTATLTLASFAISTGDLLVVAVAGEETGVDGTAPSCTWNAGAMTAYAAANANNGVNTTHWFYLTSPTQTTANIVCTNNTSVSVNYAIFAFSLVNGAAPNGFNSATDINATTVSDTIDPATANSWILSQVSIGQTDSFSAFGTGQTSTVEENVGTTASFAATYENNDASDSQSASTVGSINRWVINSIAIPPAS